MIFAHGETVTRLRPAAGVDPYSGEDTDLDWGSAETLAIKGAAIAPKSSTESVEADRSRLDVDYTLYLPYAADVKPLDRMIVRGQTFEVEGVRFDWRNPYTGLEAGSVVEVRRIGG